MTSIMISYPISQQWQLNFVLRIMIANLRLEIGAVCCECYQHLMMHPGKHLWMSPDLSCRLKAVAGTHTLALAAKHYSVPVSVNNINDEDSLSATV